MQCHVCSPRFAQSLRSRVRIRLTSSAQKHPRPVKSCARIKHAQLFQHGQAQPSSGVKASIHSEPCQRLLPVGIMSSMQSQKRCLYYVALIALFTHLAAPRPACAAFLSSYPNPRQGRPHVPRLRSSLMYVIERCPL